MGHIARERLASSSESLDQRADRSAGGVKCLLPMISRAQEKTKTKEQKDKEDRLHPASRGRPDSRPASREASREGSLTSVGAEGGETDVKQSRLSASKLL